MNVDGLDGIGRGRLVERIDLEAAIGKEREMGWSGEVAVYGDARVATRLFDGMAKIVETEPNRVFADDEVRVSGRRLVRLILLRLDGEVADDVDD